MSGENKTTPTDEPLTCKGTATSKWDLDLDRGQFGYVRGGDGAVTYLVFYPWDCPSPLPVAISPHRNSVGATWTLSGTEERPTLHPSVNAEGIWHGFLTDGVARRV